ncbi:glutathione peroxidase [bacterium]|nr:glutathione peroxidase [bacterium]
MKTLFTLSAAVLLFASCGNKANTANTNSTTEEQETMETSTSTQNFHDFEILSLNENDTLNMKDYAGKKILVVNVASKCGFTNQYEGLQKLYETYKDDLVIIGFPCNQFGGQEPGTKDDIAEFCQVNYGVTFPLSTKIDVKGDNQHPIYTWLTSKDQNGLDDYKVSWNFNKFVIDENGKLIAYFGSKVKPFDKELIDAIKS